jgi:hypothetical protein
MNQKVVPFKDFSVPTDEAIPEIVEMLEEALKQAKDGMIVGLALVKVKRQPLAFSQHYWASQNTNHSLSAGVHSIAFRIDRDLQGDED